MRSGLTSVTFRSLDVPRISALAEKASLSVIEWGGDIHCPVNDIEKALAAKTITEDNCLLVSSYGSYFRLSVSENSEFEDICVIADTLGTNTVRIWAYNKDCADVTKEEYEKCISDARIISDIAKKHGITVCFEYHRGTLTRNAEYAKKLIEDIDRENVRLYWQPNPEISHSENCRELKTVLPYVVNIHCFAWTWENNKNVRHPLSYAKEEWKNYLDIAKDGNVKNILLEFVKDETTDQLIEDASVLNKIIMYKKVP